MHEHSPAAPPGAGEGLFWETFHMSADALSVSELESGRFIDVNARFAELTGFARDELIGHTSSEMNLWVDPGARAPLIGRLEAEEVISEPELPLQTRSGDVIWVSSSMMVVTIGDQRCVLITSRDITAARRLGHAVAESEALHRTVLEAMAEGVVVQNGHGEILACNPSAERITGVSADQMRGLTNMDPRWHAVHPDGSPWPGETHPTQITLTSGRELSDELMGIYHADGSLRWVSVTTRRRRDSVSGEPDGVVATFADVTERVIAQRALEQSERRRREVVAQALEADAEARDQLARQLHDHTAQVMTAVLVQLDRLVASLRRGGQINEAEAISARTTLQSALEDVRGMIFRLRPPLLEAGGLGAALSELARRETQACGRPVEASVSIGRHDAVVEALVYRAVADLVAYACADPATTSVAVTAAEPGAVIQAVVAWLREPAATAEHTDTGAPFAELSERIQLAGGRFAVSVSPARSSVEIRLPVTRPGAPAAVRSETAQG